jgi:hypothetical protein
VVPSSNPIPTTAGGSNVHRVIQTLHIHIASTESQEQSKYLENAFVSKQNCVEDDLPIGFTDLNLCETFEIRSNYTKGLIGKFSVCCEFHSKVVSDSLSRSVC